MQELVPACLPFWEAVAKRKEPPRDPARDLYVPVGEELDHWSVLAGEYRDLLREKAGLDARLKESKEDLDRVEVALIGMMGGFLAAEAAGVKVTRYLQNGAIDYGKALEGPAPRARRGRAGDLSAQGVRTGPHHAARRGDRHHRVRRQSRRHGLAAGGQRILLLLMPSSNAGPARAVSDRHAPGLTVLPRVPARCPGEDRPSIGLLALSLSDRDRGASWAP